MGYFLIWNKVKFIDCDLHQYTCGVKEAIHIRLNPNNISRDSGTRISEAWMLTIKKDNSQSLTKQTYMYEGMTPNSQNNNEDQNRPIAANQHTTNNNT